MQHDLPPPPGYYSATYRRIHIFSLYSYCVRRETELYYLQSRYYDPELGRFINADDFVSTGQGILGNNMYAYCNNNPVICSDVTGEFSWVVVGVLVVCAAVGGILGFFYEDELGAQAKQNKVDENKKPVHPDRIDKIPSDESDSTIEPPQNKDKKISTKTRVKNALVGAGLGLAVGGGLVALGGAIGTVAVGSGATYIALFGGTGLQTTALGAAIYNLFGMVAAPFFGVEMEAIEIAP